MPKKRNFSETEADSLIEKAAAEGAYITTNHPGWPDKNSELPAYIVRHIEQKRIQGIEIFNNEEFIRVLSIMQTSITWLILKQRMLIIQWISCLT